VKRLRDRISIGKILREYRKTKGWPLVEVSELLNDYKITCSRPNLAKIEQGQFRCKADVLAALCLLYEIDINDIAYK
jgi:transcriptional regulator with XRE-family HTH domain